MQDSTISEETYPTHEDRLREMLKAERPSVIDAMIDALRPENAISGVMAAAREIRDMRIALTESEKRQTSLFEMIEDQVRATCRQEIGEYVGGIEGLSAETSRRIVREMISDGELASQGDHTDQVREIISEMVGNGEIGVTVDVDAYLTN